MAAAAVAAAEPKLQGTAVQLWQIEPGLLQLQGTLQDHRMLPEREVACTCSEMGPRRGLERALCRGCGSGHYRAAATARHMRAGGEPQAEIEPSRGGSAPPRAAAVHGHDTELVPPRCRPMAASSADQPWLWHLVAARAERWPLPMQLAALPAWQRLDET